VKKLADKDQAQGGYLRRFTLVGTSCFLEMNE